MTATPIPRTLALSVYGDLDTSIIRHRPVPGAGVTTRVLTESSRDLAYGAIREAHEKGQQSYVICPLVEPSDSADELEDVPGIARDDEGRVRSPLPLHDTATELDRLRLALPDLPSSAFTAACRRGEGPRDRCLQARRDRRARIDHGWSRWVSTCPTPPSWSSRTVSALAWRPCTSCAVVWAVAACRTCLVMTHSKGNGGASAAQDRLQSLEKTSDGLRLPRWTCVCVTRRNPGLPSARRRDLALCGPGRR